MIKKCFLVSAAVLIISGLTLSHSVFSEGLKISGSQDSQTGETKIVVSNCSGTVTMEVYNPSFSPENITVVNLKEALFDVREKEAADGKAEFVYSLSEDVDGFYTFVASCSGERSVYENPTAAEQRAAVEKVSRASAEELDGVLRQYNKVFQFDLDGDYALYKTEVCAAFVDIRKNEYSDEFQNTAQTAAAFDKAIAYGALNSADSLSVSEIITKYGSILGITPENNAEKFYSAILNVRKKLTIERYTTQNIAGALEYVKALYSINTADRLTMTAALTQYAAVLNIDLSDYNKVDKIEANKALVGKDFTCSEEINAALKAKIAQMTGKNNTTGGGSGGGGGGGGGGSAGASSNVINKVVLPDNLENIGGGKPDKTEYFSDLNGVEWAKDAINYFAEKGIINGEEENKFNPNGFVTREQFVKILAGAFSWSSNSNAGFSDVESGVWFEKYVNAAAEKGIVSGYGGKFGVGEYISRQDVAVMLYRTAMKEKIELAAKESGEPKDINKVSDYAKEAVVSLFNAGIISGYDNGEFRPNDCCTRAQICKLIYGIKMFEER